MIKTEIQISIIIIKRKSPWFDLSHLLVVGLLLQLLDKLKVFGNQTMQNDRSREEQVTFSRSSMWYNNLQAQNALKLRQRLTAWALGVFEKTKLFPDLKWTPPVQDVTYSRDICYESLSSFDMQLNLWGRSQSQANFFHRLRFEKFSYEIRIGHLGIYKRSCISFLSKMILS